MEMQNGSRTVARSFNYWIFGQALLLSVVAPVVSAVIIFAWSVAFNTLDFFDFVLEAIQTDVAHLQILLIYFAYPIYTPAWIYVSHYAANLLLVYSTERFAFLSGRRILKWVLLVSVSSVVLSIVMFWTVNIGFPS